MIQSVKSVLEMDEVKLTAIFSNNGLSHFEQQYSFKPTSTLVE